MAARAAAFLQQLSESTGAPSLAAGSGPAQEQDGGEGLRKYLLSEYKAGRFSAKALGTLSWHATRA
eukprot:7652503-Alexandrium_andersonii.AAC.1